MGKVQANKGLHNSPATKFSVRQGNNIVVSSLNIQQKSSILPIESGRCSSGPGDFQFFLDLHSAGPVARDNPQEVKDLAKADKEQNAEPLEKEEQTVLVDMPSPLTSVLLKISKEHTAILTSNSSLPRAVLTSNLLDLAAIEVEIQNLSSTCALQQGELRQVLQSCGLVAVLRQAAKLLLDFGYRVAFLYIKQVYSTPLKLMQE